ncbi:glycosyltransferase family 2 protein [Eupransor demetentiae]|uniref:GT2 family (WcaE) n=1 Tax=Eupransor demetentiae TaxID=3109584 RepID=A0ABP0EN01_9LACO|nr:GT2 family (WcaE) [Lactobacillaceae bacterium LMG 33000]
MAKTVAAAIVTYNRLDLLKECLANVLNQGEYLGHVIVVDNLSNDGTKEYLDSLDDDRLVIYHSPSNLGGAGGFNMAVKLFAEKLDDDYVWLMDDDTMVQENALKYLVEFMDEHPQTSFVNSQVRWGSIDGNPSWMNVNSPRAFTWPRFLQEDNQAIEVVNSTFVSVMFSRDMVAMVGLPQKEYFIWGDDIEYTNRMANAYRGYMVVKSLAVHKSKENTLPGDIVRESDAKRLWRYRYEFRNRVLTARRISKKELFFVLAKIYCRDLVKLMITPRVAYRFKKIGMVGWGGIRGLFFNPKIEYADIPRKPVRSINKLIKEAQAKQPGQALTMAQELEIIEDGQK